MFSLPTPRRTSRVATRRGFTILELLIVIGIILAIGGIVTVNLMGMSDKADTNITQVKIQNFERALKSFKLDMKRYPSEEEGLVVLWDSNVLEDEAATANWNGPYLEEPAPMDTWGFEWIYRAPSDVEGVAFDIISIGPDGEEGTDDDLTNLDGRVGADGEPLDDEFSDFSPAG
ncbi:MAG: type II secretion system major pseudopilin GspG [Phycisphaerales bacterium]|nr:type II secretion system major pseudopilin GspG [Phycisphaerales bacterium]